MDGCITIAGLILLIVGIILCVVGYNTLNGLLLLIGIAAVAVGVGLTFGWQHYSHSSFAARFIVAFSIAWPISSSTIFGRSRGS